MQNLFSWLVDNWFVWIIALFAGWRAVKGITDQKIGHTLLSIGLGGLAYYFVKNPEKVLKFVGDIVGRIFG
ncbi:TcpD family membrane protein [Streptococcus pluranimalium]|uniref:TcpD family membrane protein n=1 Tax=Streptococcus pluranimalium TaxID=82348 RepID=UPI00136D65AD|nr:hypothetical protein [Streptococcus pneumoniae]